MLRRGRLRVLFALIVVLLLSACIPPPESDQAAPRAVARGERRAAPSAPEATPDATEQASEDLGPASDEELLACIAGGEVTFDELGDDPVDAPDAAGQVEEITDRVEDLRDLPQQRELDPQFLSDDEIEARTDELVLDDYPVEEADVDARLLAALGAVPPRTDLRALQADLLSGQILGYYDPETDELVVRSADPDQPLGPNEQNTLAHEVEHALADQAFDLERVDDLDADAATAFIALVEGDATLTDQRFGLQAFDMADQMALVNDPEAARALDRLSSFPNYLIASLEFPYTEGLAFVCDRYAEGGWAAVDAAYRSPPATTAEILFPDRYPLTPADPRPPAAPGGAWREVDTDTLGAADLLWLFSAPGDDPAAALDGARERVSDWAGGRVSVHADGDATAVGLALVGGAGQGVPLCDSLREWYDAAFPDAAEAPPEGAVLARDGADQDAVLVCEGDEVRLGIAPDLATARTLTG
jgi:hypothetical protein